MQFAGELSGKILAFLRGCQMCAGRQALEVQRLVTRQPVCQLISEATPTDASPPLTTTRLADLFVLSSWRRCSSCLRPKKGVPGTGVVM